MIDDLVADQVRTWPLGPAKVPIAPRPTWPACALLYAAEVDRDGGLVHAWTVEQFLGRPYAETGFANVPESESELRRYAAGHRAAVLGGCDDEIQVRPVATIKLPDGRWDGLGYRVRQRSYRSGDVFVVAGMGQLTSVAAKWVPSRSHPGGFTYYPLGLVDAEVKPFTDSAGLTVRRAGDRFVATWTGGRWDAPKKGQRLAAGKVVGRGKPRRGPIVDVLNLATALRGEAIADVDTACRLFGMSPPEQTGERVADLRARCHAIGDLYWRLVLKARGMDLALNLGFLVSTGGIGTALLREAGL